MFSPPRMIISLARPVMRMLPSSLCVAHARQVAAMQPALRIDGAGGGVRVIVVSLHHQVAARAQLALFAGGQGLSVFGMDDLHLGARERAPDSRDTDLQWVVGGCLRDGGRRLAS